MGEMVEATNSTLLPAGDATLAPDDARIGFSVFGRRNLAEALGIPESQNLQGNRAVQFFARKQFLEHVTQPFKSSGDLSRPFFARVG